MQTDLQDAIVLLIENALAHFDNHFYESALMLHVAHVFRELYIKDLVIKTEKEVVENGNEIKRCDLILEDSKTITVIELKRKHPQWIDFTSSNQQEAKSHGFELNSLTDTDKINYGDSYQRLKNHFQKFYDVGDPNQRDSLLKLKVKRKDKLGKDTKTLAFLLKDAEDQLQIYVNNIPNPNKKKLNGFVVYSFGIPCIVGREITKLNKKF